MMRTRPRRLIARLAVVALATTSLAALAVPGASGGPPSPGVFDVPAGATLTVVEPYLNGCNQLEWGYEVSGQSGVVVDQWAGGCANKTYDDKTIGPFAAATTVRLFLTDVSCGATYFSDGTSEGTTGNVDHAVVTGVGPWHVEIADAQVAPGCPNKDTPSQGANFAADVRIDPVLTVKKVVTGDDPGIAFPIAVSCTSDGIIPKDVVAAADPQIVLDDVGDTDATTVDLKNGQSANIPIVIDDVHIDSVTCTVSESLAGVALPAGYTCATPAIDHPQVIWGQGEWTANPVVVTNSCTKTAAEVVAQPNFPG